MKSCIYLEGGARGPGSKELSIRCQKAFSRLLDKMGFKGRKPRLVACGARDMAFERFCIEHARGRCGYVALWIDSEEPIRRDFIKAEHSGVKAWMHLAALETVAPWQRPAEASDDQVLFMTTCMETWIVADRHTLRKHYGPDLLESLLPPLVGLEACERGEVQQSLELATRNCRNAYAKGKRSYAVLEALKPEALRMFPSFVRVDRILQEKL